MEITHVKYANLFLLMCWSILHDLLFFFNKLEFMDIFDLFDQFYENSVIKLVLECTFWQIFGFISLKIETSLK